MKKIGLSILFGLFLHTLVWGQRKLTEGTIYYDVVINTNDSKPSVPAMMDGATTVVSLKGSSSRSDFISSLGSQSTIIDGKTGAVTILKDYGDQKFMSTLSQSEWKNINKRYDNLTYTIENEFKTIATYNCQKAIGKLSDGTTFTVYFTKDLIPVNNEFQNINRNLPGLAMEYEASLGKTKITYTVSNIDFGAVPLSKFDLPQSGYRVVPYPELIKGKK